MIKVKNTPQLVGITILGDYEDLNALYDAVSNYCRFILDHQDHPDAEHCLEFLLGLCYDLRHAYQGDRGYEAVENHAASIGGMAEILYEVPQKHKKKIQSVRSAFKNGNLYFSVDVLYPWALYYMFTLQALTEESYRQKWFDEQKAPFDQYDPYQAKRDEALLIYFIQLLWEALGSELPEDVMKHVFQYSTIYTRTNYYISYPDMYLEWLCTWWAVAPVSREHRRSLLPLLCLELSSVDEEAEFELEEELAEETEALNRLLEKRAAADSDDADRIDEKKGDSGSVSPESSSGIATEIAMHRFHIDVINTSLNTLRMYDDHYDQVSEQKIIPYLSMYEYLEQIYEHTENHGLFDRHTYDEYLSNEIGDVDWDELEW